MQRDYGTNSSFPKDPFSSAPNPSFHQQSVWSGAPGGLAGGVAFSHPRTNDCMVQPRGFSPVPQYPVLCYPGDNIFLPRPEFPEFNGDPLNFTTFKNEFVKYWCLRFRIIKCCFVICCNIVKLKFEIRFNTSLIKERWLRVSLRKT